eukprot:TRINITY_DN3686_c0_g1_i1.p2 TRINITY_DN3686_c0_g1~~TRINITY_DN3686_c0_g1_i1.p2  ORF type:complete len:109 (-),score=10.13 TRINITY_DN3686_c0_g1_i1:223-549(-)
MNLTSEGFLLYPFYTKAVSIPLCVQEVHPDLFLQRADFPDFYTDKWEHPDNYKLTDAPVWEVIDHHARLEQRHRTILRTCFKVDGGKYLPFSAILDSGAPKPLYLSRK